MKFVVSWIYEDKSACGVFAVCDTEEKAKEICLAVSRLSNDKIFGVTPTIHIKE